MVLHFHALGRTTAAGGEHHVGQVVTRQLQWHGVHNGAEASQAAQVDEVRHGTVRVLGSQASRACHQFGMRENDPAPGDL